MKILLMSLNSKFIHTNLAIHSIKTYFEHQRKASKVDFEGVEITLKEYTINNDLDSVLRDIARGHYTHIFASSYIWNIEAMEILFSNLKLLNADIKIIFGGPEVTYDPIGQMHQRPFLDAVVCGEGEATFYELIKNSLMYDNLKAMKQTRGIAYKSDDTYIVNDPMPRIETLDDIPFPYSDMTLLENRIIYYESSRGCPYSCSYCLSSATKGVRHMSVERVKCDLDFFLSKRVDQVKFVDRTFNTSKTHALPILKHLIEHDNGVTNFHFEITASLLDEDYFNILRLARPGLIQFEVGVQTTHEVTMHAIHRPMSFDFLKTNCQRVLAMGNIHLHVDLIAGLPYESFQRFLDSFDDVYSIGAHQLQLGFLKVLKGTAISRELELHDYKVRFNAPYEVLANKYISFDEMCTLKDVEALLEYYSNSGKFNHSLSFFMKRYGKKPSTFFVDFASFFRERAYFDSPVGTYRLYEIMYDYYTSKFGDSDLFKDLLKVDYHYANLKGHRDLFNYEELPGFSAKRLALLGNQKFQMEVLGLESLKTAKQILKNVEFITLKYDIMALIQSDYKEVSEKVSVILFDYAKRDSTRMIAISFEEEQ